MPVSLTPFEEVWPLLAGLLQPLATERLPLGSAAGRVLRADGRARWDLPTADNSAMDGFAVRAEDTDGSSPAVLRLLDRDAYAGTSEPPPVSAGVAVAIGTGGLIPPGADAVVPKEHAVRDGDRITVEKPTRPGAHIRCAGEELHRGDLVVESGAALEPLRLAALAAAGVHEVEVNRLPEVRVLTSGNEIVPLGETIRPGQVVDSNGPFLRASLQRLLGTTPPVQPALRDEPEAVEAALAEALQGADLVVVTGGVSVGDRDLIKAILEQRLGVERVVWRIAQKPGKPMYIGRRGSTWVLGLPGNPAAVGAMWTVYAAPLLRALMGVPSPEPRRLPVRLSNAVKPNAIRTHLRWACSTWQDGRLCAEVLNRAGSHMLSDFARADVLVVVPPGDEELPPGTGLQAMAIDR